MSVLRDSMARSVLAVAVSLALARGQTLAAAPTTLAEAARLTTVRLLDASPAQGVHEQLPPEPKKETGPQRKRGFFRSPGGIVVLAVAGALVVGATARSILDNDDGRSVD